MDSGWTAFFGAIVGGVIAGVATWGMSYWRDKVSSRNWAIAVAGELAAVTEVVRFRHWLDALAGIVAEARRGNVYCLSVKLPEETLTVTRQAMLHAGMLRGALPSLIAKVVISCDGVVQDFHRLYEHGVDQPKSMVSTSDPKFAAEFYAELTVMLLRALQDCDAIVAEVRRIYPNCGINATTPTDSEFLIRQAFGMGINNSPAATPAPPS